MRNVLISVFACVFPALLSGCPAARQHNARDLASSVEAKPNTTDIISVDQKAGTFVALARRDHTTDRILAKCGTVCPNLGKNFAGFWTLPPSQVSFDVISRTETEGLKTQ